MKKTKDTRPHECEDEAARERLIASLTALSVTADRELDPASADLVQILIGLGLRELGVTVASWCETIH